MTPPPQHPSTPAAPAIGPRGTRRILNMACAIGLIIGAGCGWMHFAHIDPLSGPDWAFALMALSLVAAPVLIAVGCIALLRGYQFKTLAKMTVAINAVAALLGSTLLGR